MRRALYFKALFAFLLYASGAPAQQALPDLVPEVTDLGFSFNASVESGDLAESCASAPSGVDLLRFTTVSHNVGSGDVVLGDPMCPEPCDAHAGEPCGNPNFVCSPAGGHNHAHYQDFIHSELLNGMGQRVAFGSKQGFCLRDDVPSTCTTYTCDFQGLSAGCSDIYFSFLGCQYVEVSALPPGSYRLRVRIDPLNRIAEANESNNVVEIPLMIPANRSTACAAATAIPAQGGTFTGSTSGAGTLSSKCTPTSAAPEAVFSWTPAVSGTATVDTCGSQFDTSLYVRQADCEGGTDLACGSVWEASCGPGDRGARLQLSVTAGQTYFVIVDGLNGASGSFQLTVTPPDSLATPTAAPTGSCAAPIVIPSEGGVFDETTGGSSLESGGCGITSNSPEKVFQWTPAVSGSAVFETCGASTSFDTIVYVRGGSCSASSEIGCNDDAAGCQVNDGSGADRGSRLSLNVTAGETYFIVVDGYNGAAGPFRLRVTPPGGASPTPTAAAAATATPTMTATVAAATATPTPTRAVVASSTPTPTAASGGGCDGRTVIPDSGGTFAGSTSGQSLLAGSCSLTNNSPEKVFQWTPSVTGSAVIETCGSGTSFDTVLYLRGTSCSTANDIACNDDTAGCRVNDGSGSDRGSRLTVEVAAGQTYFIVVDGWNGSSGDFQLTVVPPGSAASATPTSTATAAPVATPTWTPIPTATDTAIPTPTKTPRSQTSPGQERRSR